jgi:DNA-binding transcriptional regulator GbsR (MarR family)
MTESLEAAERLAADAIGDVIEHWGFRKALGRTWTLLFLRQEPQPASEISDRLAMSAGAVSGTLNELQRWGVVRRVWKPGERKEFYEAETDFWKMISRVVSERERFLAESVEERLAEATELARQTPASPQQDHFIERVTRLSQFAQVAKSVMDSFIRSQRADFQLFGNVLSMGRARGAGRDA